MVSPYRQSEHSRASPARHTNGLHRPHRGSSTTSSSTLLDELSQLLMDDDRAFRKVLDEQSLKQQKLHVEALEKALAQHEAVRRSAEQMHEKIQIEIESERKRQEADAQRELDEARRKAVEEEQQREDERQAREAALERQQEESARIVAAKKQQQEEAEQARQKAAKGKEEAERKIREQAEAQRAAQQQKAEAEKQVAAVSVASNAAAAPPVQATPSQTNGIGAAGPSATQSRSTPAQSLPNGIVTARAEREATHQAYRAIHQRLKEVRAHVKELGEKDPNFRELMAGARREISQTVGQLNVANKTINAQKTRKIKALLETAIKMNAPMINGSLFLHPAPEEQIDVPLTLIYLVNMFAKKILASLDNELQGKPAVERAACADPMGIMVAQIFAVPDFHIKDRSLIDIFWAKYHVVCPMLFGLPYDPDQKGIKGAGVGAYGAGFAAVTLRDFSSSPRRNPAPNRIFWEAIARILNMPPTMQGRSQYEILTSFLSPGFVERFIKFYGQAAIVVLKKTLDDFPKWVMDNSENQQGRGYALRKYATSLRAMRAHLDTSLRLSL